MGKRFKLVSTVACLLLVVGCVSQTRSSQEAELDVKNSAAIAALSAPSAARLGPANGVVLSFADGGESASKAQALGSQMKMLQPVEWPETVNPKSRSLGQLFPKNGQLEVNAERMPVRDFVHYVFGDLLAVNYVLDESISEAESTAVTLSTSAAISKRALFKLSSELLLQRNIEIIHGDGTFFVSALQNAKKQSLAVIGVGRNPENVPSTIGPIMQVVPLTYGVKITVERTLDRLIKAKFTADHDQSVMFIEGNRSSILQALELIELLDTPATRSKYVGLIGLAFLSPDDYAKDVALLLENEGIVPSIGKPGQRNVVLVPLRQIGAVAVFASDLTLLDRVRYWTKLIDVPGGGSNEQYFIYSPTYARAIDLGDSVSALLTGVTGPMATNGADSRRVDAGSRTTGNAPSSTRVRGVEAGGVRMVVDERSNSLIFYTSGSRYRALMPMLKRLDTLPKQVLLEITIAEVSLKDEFKHGVEWALSRGEVNISTNGAFGAAAIGGLGLIVNGTQGPLTANFLNSNSLVNVLSQPSLMVRDGVTANINVGSEISVVGQTTQDPISGDRQTTTSEYRQTGVDVTVTPTVNAQGVVVMEISQVISNSVPSSSGAGGNPDIFKRSISTELVAQSGQTVMMAGLISENSSRGGSGTPGISNLPLIGNLFKARSQSTDRTELVMLVTPRVISNLDQWNDVMQDFREQLRYLKINKTKEVDN